MQVERGLVLLDFNSSGKRESNTLVTYPQDRDNSAKAGLIPDVLLKLRFKE